ncbi:Permease cytosine/purines uracil thiamine allantoin [Neofusicoccum parvum]|uniref:Permease cytosine/purines uracil thiamine allantoin n=1 Tax=Neofusicoccum parvum TaxID=310453 RepID=A0ACB5SMP5_9PEZI|nr:Permease cytosine/purines uracil thiamine allantoin [Neofusicoccum parvum]
MADRIRRRIPSRETVRQRLTSVKAWELEVEPSSLAPRGAFSNADTDPTPKEKQTWKAYTLIFYWFSDILTIQGWESMATIIKIGLTYKEAIWCTLLGDFLIAIPVVLNGHIGTRLRVPFPIQARSSFGFHAAKGVVCIRIATALFWHALQTYSGSQVMAQVLTAIWPSFGQMPNHIPASQDIDSKTLVAHLLFWLLQLPFVLIPPHKMTWFFYTKAALMIATSLGIVGYLVHRAGTSGEIFNQRPTVDGSERAWLTVYMLFQTVCGWATMATNIADVSRYVKSPRHQIVQAASLPLVGLYIGAMGMLACSASRVVYGAFIWSPAELFTHWQATRAGRAAVVFAGLSFCLAQIGINMSANIVSLSNDLAGLFPRHLNIRRGALLGTLAGGWVMVPWKISGSAPQLVTFVSALAIFLAPIAAILIADYFVVKRRAVDVPALYDPRGRYAYWRGTNPRAVAALLVAVAPNLPGLAHDVSPNLRIGGAVYIYYLNYAVGFGVAAAVYVALNVVFPARESLVPRTVYAYDDASAEEGGEGSGGEERGEKGASEVRTRPDVLP